MPAVTQRIAGRLVSPSGTVTTSALGTLLTEHPWACCNIDYVNNLDMT